MHKIHLTKSMISAREVLLVIVLFFASGPSFWLPINGDTSHEFHLRRLLGFYNDVDYYAFLIRCGFAGYTGPADTDGKKQLEIYGDQLKAFLNNEAEGLSVYNAEHTKKAFDMEGLIRDGRQDAKKRYDYHLLRLGLRESETYTNQIAKQKTETGRLNTKPPLHPGRRAQQRIFKRNAQKLIADIISENDDLYDDAMQDRIRIKAVPAKPKEDGHETAGTPDELGMPTKPTETEDVTLFTYHVPTPKRQRTSSPERANTNVPRESRAASTNASSMISPDAVPKKGDGIAYLEALGEAKLDNDTMRQEMLSYLIALEQAKAGSAVSFTVKDHKYHRTSSFVKVSQNSSDIGFAKHPEWIDTCIEINGKDGKMKSAKRIAKHIKKRYQEAFDELLNDEGLKKPPPMGSTEISAMFKLGKVSGRHQRRGIMKVLRNHFGKQYFVPELKVQMKCDGHSPVNASHVMHAYKDGEKEEKLEYTEKNLAAEVSVQLKRQLESRSVKAGDVAQVDVITGGDHGKGAFIVGSKIIVTMDTNRQADHSESSSDSDDDNDDVVESFSFEISVAELICSKDNSDVLTKTIKRELTKGLETISKEGLEIKDGDEVGKVDCRFVTPSDDTLKCNVYIVGDLAFYAMVLGRESSSPHHCYLCQLSASDYADLLASGEPWTYELMEQYAAEYRQASGRKKTAEPTKGCKEKPWWPFIPLLNVIVPLLHCLIGIGNDILTLFRDIISEKIEYLPPEEVEIRGALTAIEKRDEEIVAERIAFDATPDGIELDRLKKKRTRAKKALKKLDVISTNAGPVAAGATTPYQFLLDQIKEFIADDSADVEEQEVNDDAAAGEDGQESGAVSQPSNAVAGGAIGLTIDDVKKTIRDCEKDIKPLQKERDVITNRLKKARDYAKKLKAKITEAKAKRKKAGDGIETAIFSVLREGYDVRIQAYHGGSLTGKDIQKVMVDADEIFAIIAGILKAQKKDGCEYNDNDIDALCKQFSDLLVLWDGAFSYSSKIDPGAEDISQYKRFVKAAVFSHRAAGLSITHKVHLMYRHVALQMDMVPGGLGNKREDWLEHQHQTTNRKRGQYGSTKNRDVRAAARERSHHQDTDPKVNKYIALLDAKTRRGPRENFTSVQAERRAKRVARRHEILDEWQARWDAQVAQIWM